MIAGLAALGACGEPLGKHPMLAGCEASAAALNPELDSAALDYRAVVGREAILRFHVPQAAGEPKAVNVKCKVNMRGALKRITIDGVPTQGEELAAAQAAFSAAARL